MRPEKYQSFGTGVVTSHFPSNVPTNITSRNETISSLGINQEPSWLASGIDTRYTLDQSPSFQPCQPHVEPSVLDDNDDSISDSDSDSEMPNLQAWDREDSESDDDSDEDSLPDLQDKLQGNDNSNDLPIIAMQNLAGSPRDDAEEDTYSGTSSLPELQDRFRDDSDSDDDSDNDSIGDGDERDTTAYRTAHSRPDSGYRSLRLRGGGACDNNDEIQPSTKQIPTTIYLPSDEPRGEPSDNDGSKSNNNNDTDETRMIDEFYENSDITPEPEDDNEELQEEPTEIEEDGSDESLVQPHNPLEDEIPPTNPPPSYTPLLSKNDDWGDTLLPRIMYENDDFIRIYSQNVNGVTDSEGTQLDLAFNCMNKTEADIFTFNETHYDKTNPVARKALTKSMNRLYKKKNGHYCTVVTSSSIAPVTTFTKPGGNLMGITGALTGRIRERIDDKYGRWCGVRLEGRDDRKILILTAYNVPQDISQGDDTLHSQQTSMYMLDGIDNPNPRKLFVEGLIKVIEQAVRNNDDIILTGDFNEVIGEDSKLMARVLRAGHLIDVHEKKHGNACNIATYIRGRRRLDY